MRPEGPLLVQGTRRIMVEVAVAQDDKGAADSARGDHLKAEGTTKDDPEVAIPCRLIALWIISRPEGEHLGRLI